MHLICNSLFWLCWRAAAAPFDWGPTNDAGWSYLWTWRTRGKGVGLGDLCQDPWKFTLVLKMTPTNWQYKQSYVDHGLMSKFEMNRMQTGAQGLSIFDLSKWPVSSWRVKGNGGLMVILRFKWIIDVWSVWVTNNTEHQRAITPLV